MKKIIQAIAVFFLAAMSYADDPPLISGRITILGSRLEVFPSSLETPAGVPVFIQTTGKGLAGKIQGELRGPSISGALTVETIPGESFQLPPLTTKGQHSLEDIRLVSGGQVAAMATPDRVVINVIDVLISEVTSRPLSLDEIRSLGIVINEENYSGVSFQVGLTFNSQQIQIAFPVLIPKDSSLQPLIPPSVINAAFSGPPVITDGSPTSLPEMPAIVPVAFKSSPEFDIQLPDIPGILVFPNEIAFLNQFFAVVVMVRNAASSGSSLAVDDLTAQAVIDPSHLRLAKTNPVVPLGSPVPVRVPGPDGLTGTSDDLELIIAQQMAQAEFFVEGLTEGTHTVRFNLNGTVKGLLQGDVPITGSAVGAVLVRNPNFAITFSHPSVVRAFEPYDLFITVTNTSVVDANLVRLTLASNQLVNVRVLDDPSATFDSIQSGESATAKFRMEPQVTGQVTTAVMTGSGSVQGQFQFRVGVGEKGIPLSPNTLVLPEYAHALGSEIVQDALNFLGLAYSAATAPPGGLPPGVPYLSKSIVSQRAVELAQAGQRFQLGEARSDALSHLMLDWLGNNVPDQNFDLLRRTSDRGADFLDEVFRQLNIGGSNAIQFHQNFGNATFFRNRYLSAMLQTTGVSSPQISIVDASGSALGDLMQSADGGAQWNLVGNLPEVDENAFYKLLITGAGSNNSGTLSLIVPIGSQFYRAELQASFDQTKSYELLISNAELVSGFLALKDQSGNLISAQLQPLAVQPLQAIAAVQDAKADKTGHIVAVLFNRPVDETAAESIANYEITGNRTAQAILQNGRIVYLAFANPVSPLVSNDLTIRDMNPPLPGGNQMSLPVQTTATTDAGRVRGRVIDSTGKPIAGATVTLTELDEDDLFGEVTAHVTASTTTDAFGEFAFDYVRKLDRPFALHAQDPLTGELGSSGAIISQPGQILRLDIIMLGRGTVQGKVFKRVSGNIVPVANAIVTAISFLESSPRSVLTDSAGNYKIDRVAVGNVNLTAQNQNLAEPEKYFGQTSTSIPAAGAIANADIEVVTYQPGEISGRVLQSNAIDPIIGAYVLLSVDVGADVPLQLAAFSDQEGSFRFDQVPAGVVTITATDRSNGRFIGIATVNLAPGGSAVVNIVSQGNGSIEVHITPTAGMSLADIAVYISGTSFIKDPANASPITFSNVPVGNWTVVAINKVTGDQAAGNATIHYANQTAVASIRFAEKGTVRGIVRTVDGMTAVRTTVLLFGGFGQGALLKLATTDANGAYLINDVELGRYAAHAIAENLNDGGQAANLVDVATGNRNPVADITFVGKGSVKVHVRTAVGPVITTVSLNTVDFEVDGRILRDVVYKKLTDSEGNATFDNLFRKPFSASASTPLTLPGTVSGTLNGPYAEVEIFLDTNPSISGTVHNADGQPVLATVTYNGASGEQTLTTDSGGRFTFHGLAHGYASFVASANGTLGEKQIQITQTNPDIDIHLLGFGDVSGMVKTAAGQFEPGANLKLIVPGLLARTLIGQSRSDGTYSFSGVPEGPFTIEATNGVIGGRASGSIIHRAEISLDVVLDASATVQGTVFKSDGQTRLANGEVHLTGPSSGTTTTDGNGNFIFRYVPLSHGSQDQYQLSAIDKNTGRRAESGYFLLTTDGEIWSQNLILQGLGTVSGFVFDASGQTPIAGALLELRSFGIIDQNLLATTGANGDFRFSAVPQGSYKITASKDLLAAQVSGSINSDGGATTHTILMEPSASLRGTIVFSDGITPAPANAVPIVTLFGPNFTRLIDAPGGEFLVNGLPLGDYTITTRFTYNNIPYRGIAHTSITQGGETSLTLRLKGLNTLQAQINGFVDASSTVTLTYRNEMETVSETRPAPTGSALFEFVPESSFTLSARTETISGSVLTGSATGEFIGDNETKTVTIDLTQSGSVSGTVLRGQQPAPAVSITLTSGSMRLFAYTDGAGAFRIDGVPLGAYTLTAEDLAAGGKARLHASIDAAGEQDQHTLTLDTVRPAVTSVTPSPDAIGISNDSTITVVFSEPMEHAAVLAAFVLNSPDGTAVPGAITAFYPQEYVFTPANVLQPLQTYTVVVKASAEDAAGNSMAADFTSTFTTVDTVPPVVTNTLPVNMAFNVATTTGIQIFFNEPIADKGNLNISRSSSLAVPAFIESWNPSRTSLTLQFAQPFVENERVAFSIQGFRDDAGNVQDQTSSFFFDTVDTLPPAAPELTADQNPIREGATVTVTAAVSESFLNVDFFVNGALKLHDITAPYTYSIPSSFTTIAANGGTQLLVEAMATDRSGNTSGRQSLVITLQPDTAPQVSISTDKTSPVLAGDTITVNYAVSDDGIITKTLVIVTGAINTTFDQGTSVSGSVAIDIPVTTPDGSSIFIKARATDDSGKSTTTSDSAFVINKDTDPPNVVVSHPASLTEGEELTVTANVTDNLAVDRVEFFWNNITVVDNAAPYQAQFIAPDVGPDTNFPGTVKGFDTTGNNTTADFTVLVKTSFDPDKPTAQFLCPTADQGLFPAGYDMPMTVRVTDDSNVSKVEFYRGSDPIAFQTVVLNPPSSHTTVSAGYLLNGVSVGDRLTFRAVVYDFGGKTGEATTTIEIIAGVDVTTNTVVAPGSSNPYENQTVIVRSGASFTLNGPHTFNDLIVLSGGVVNHPDTTPITEHKLEVNASRLFVACGGTISVSGLGYDIHHTYPNSKTGGVTFDGEAGSYGGVGGGSSPKTYGSYQNPMESGAGSARSSGGGVVLIEAGSVVVDGSILANGGDTGVNVWATAAGGAIRIKTQSISGSGTITANGGQIGVTGGGGRVAVYYEQDNMTGGMLSRISARGGAQSNAGASDTGGAGTIYLFRNSASTYGDLIVDNTGVAFPQNSRPTQLPAVGKGTITALSGNEVTCQRSGTSAAFDWGVIGLYLRIFNADGTELGSYKIVAQNGLKLTLEGNIGPEVIGKSYRGVVKLDSVKVQGNALLKTDDFLELPQDVTFGGTSRIEAEISVLGNLTLAAGVKEFVSPVRVSGSLIVENGAVLRHRDTTPAEEYRLDLRVGSLVIEAGGSINVRGLGYDKHTTYPNSTTGGVVFDGEAGSYGGVGGGSSPKTYGSFPNPMESGAGSARSSGGGVVLIEAGSVVVDGSITANGGDTGVNVWATAAGGAIRIKTQSISGNGTITANGGQIGVTGGGGRVAVYYEQDNTTGGLLSRISARGGAQSNAGELDTGGAGTIYLHKTGTSIHGDLIVDNTGVAFPQNSRPTDIRRIGSGTISQLSADPLNPDIWLVQTAITAGWDYSVEGGYLILTHSGGAVSSPYYILGRSSNDVKTLRIFVDRSTGQLLPSEIGIVAGDTYSGLYKLDSINVKGGGRLIFSDPIQAPQITVAPGSVLQAPNYP